MKIAQGNSSPPRKPAKRRRYDSAFKRHLVELTLVPAATVARIALEHHISASLLCKWRRHYLREVTAATGQPAATVLPVTIAEPNGALEALAGAAPVASPRGSRQRVPGAVGVIEIDLPLARVRLTGNVALEALRVVLEALAQR